MRALKAATLGVLLVAAFPAFPPATAATEKSCGRDFSESIPDADQCTFLCEAAHRLSIEIYATDETWGAASVSGSARCGDGYSPCHQDGGENRCYGDSGIAQRWDDRGKCTAAVDEWINDPWSYHCAATKVQAPACPTPPCQPGPPPGNCVFGLVCCPAVLCGGGGGAPSPPGAPPTCAVPAGVAPEPTSYLDLANRVAQRCRDALLGTSSVDRASGLPEGVASRVDVRVVGHEATARLCVSGEGCWHVLPACAVSGGRRTCEVGAGAKILAPAPRFG